MDLAISRHRHHYQPACCILSGVTQSASHRFGTKQAWAAHLLRQRILDGVYMPGTRLREESISVDLGMSPTPVREALRVLTSEGLVESDWHRGATVVRLFPSDIAEIYRIREELETLATSLAIRKMRTATRTRLAEDLRESTNRLRATLESGDFEAVPRLNREFHWLVYEMCGSPRLLQLIERQWNTLPHSWLRRMPGRAAWVLQEHLGIVSAFQGDAETVASEMRGHIGRAAETLIDLLGEDGLPAFLSEEKSGEFIERSVTG